MKKRECPGCSGNNLRVHGLVQAMLLLLLHERPGHGYDLMKRLDRELPVEMIPDQAVVYRMLREMERGRYAISNMEPGKGGPGRKVYSITDDGEVFLQEWYRLIQLRVAALNRFIEKYETAASPVETGEPKDVRK
ncbi:MAG: PadR family transcriptional regulator [Candidatus Bipolaricaulota bacterium]|nr:PadR family transcriptional regulator [Candidatus Bipolaricaulota bacterium]